MLSHEVAFDNRATSLSADELHRLIRTRDLALARYSPGWCGLETIVVEGHADKSESLTETLLISEKRAATVADALRNLGVPSRVRIFYTGKGGSAPKGNGVQGNRRADIEFAGDRSNCID